MNAIQYIGGTAWRTGGPVRQLTVSTDSQFVITVSSGNAKVVRALDSASGEIRTLLDTGHRITKIQSVAADTVATSSTDGTIRFWDLASAKEITRRRIMLDGAVRDFAFSPRGAWIAIVESNAVYRVALGKSESAVPVMIDPKGGSRPGSTGIHPQGDLWVVSIPPSVLLYGRMSDPLGSLGRVSLESRFSDVNFSSDGRCLALVDYGPSGTSLIVETNHLHSVPAHSIRTLVGGHSVAFHPHDGSLAVGDWEDGVIRFTDATGIDVSRILTPVEGKISHLCYSPAGDCLFMGGRDGYVWRWDCASKAIDNVPEFPPIAVRALARHPYKHGLLAYGGGDAITAARFRAAVWDNATRDIAERLPAMSAPVRAIAYSPDGKTLAAATGTSGEWPHPCPPEIVFSDASGVWSLRGHKKEIRGIAFSADGGHLASVDADAVRVWDLKSRRECAVMEMSDQHLPEGCGVAWSPSDRIYIATSAHLDLSRASQLIVCGGPGLAIESIFPLIGVLPSSMILSPDAKQIVIGTRRGEICVLNACTGSEVVKVQRHRSSVLGLAVSDDGESLATASNDGTVGVWSIPNGLNGELLSIGTPLFSVVFSRSGAIAAGGVEGNILQWNPGPLVASN